MELYQNSEMKCKLNLRCLFMSIKVHSLTQSHKVGGTRVAYRIPAVQLLGDQFSRML